MTPCHSIALRAMLKQQAEATDRGVVDSEVTKKGTKRRQPLTFKAVRARGEASVELRCAALVPTGKGACKECGGASERSSALYEEAAWVAALLVQGRARSSALWVQGV